MDAAPGPSKPPRTLRQRLVRWFFICLTGYVGAIVVLMLMENWLVFRAAGPDDWTLPPTPQIQDVELTSAAGDKIHGWWLPREGSIGAILFLHGNAGNLSWRGSSICVLGDQLDQSVLIIDYPGYGKSSGQATEAGCYAAADAAYDWLTTTKRIPAKSIVIYGESLGGGVAVDLASRQPHRALVLIKTFTSLPDAGQSVYPFLPVRWVMRNQFDSLSKIGFCKQPTFITHGDADRLIPFAQGQRLYEAAPGPKQFLHLPGKDHNDSMPYEYFAALKQFLAKMAPQPTAAK